MKCLECHNSFDCSFFKEVFTCYHCNKEVYIYYNYCPICGALWKSCDNNLIPDTLMHMDIEEANEAFDFKDDMFEFFKDFVDSKVDNSDRKSSMEDIVHKCLRCDAIAFEIEKDKYECPSCGFKWEVIRSDD